MSLAQVKYTIAVASGKGGVGKSTVAVNLALALSQLGLSAGIMDADIYGPSLPTALGVDLAAARAQAEQKTPYDVQGLRTMSIGYLVDPRTPMVWRGPMATGALQQLLLQTAWGVLDVLIIDMPPGTGDIQLTLCQKVALSGAVIVTTPQDLALMDARKGIEMFAKVAVPTLGIIENMAWHTCSQCGFHSAIFGEGGGLQLATDYHTQMLGQIPLEMSIRLAMDQGRPSVVAQPDGVIAQAYRMIAENVLSIVSAQQQQVMPEIRITPD
jgi:ATP-binding protein involved in chromosome partitioning